MRTKKVGVKKMILMIPGPVLHTEVSISGWPCVPQKGDTLCWETSEYEVSKVSHAMNVGILRIWLRLLKA